MSINSVNGKNTGAAFIKSAASRRESTDAQPARSVENADQVAITAVAKQIQRAFQSSPVEAAIDYGRVAAVKKALAEGSYVIDPERIAKKMIEFEKPLSKHGA